MLGKAESTSSLNEHFVLEHAQFRVYRRHGERILMPAGRPRYTARFASPRGRGGPGGGRSGHARSSRGDQRVADSDEGYLLKLPVGMIVVDRRYDIRSINGVARRLLGIYNAAIGDDLIHTAQGVPSRTLREAIDRAFQSGDTANLQPFPVEEPLGDTRRHLQLTCYPQRTGEERGTVETVLIVVNDVTDALRERGAAEVAGSGDGATAAPPTPEEQERQIARLVEQNRQLMEANQGLVSANEELRATNEEFVISVEEAQAWGGGRWRRGFVCGDVRAAPAIRPGFCRCAG